MVVECPGVIPNHTHSASFLLHKTMVGQSFIWCVEAIVWYSVVSENLKL